MAHPNSLDQRFPNLLGQRTQLSEYLRYTHVHGPSFNKQNSVQRDLLVTKWTVLIKILRSTGSYK